MERDLRSQLDEAQRNGLGFSQWESKYNDLGREHQILQSKLREQQRVTEEVRREASGFLKEMKEMSDRSGSAWDREEKLSKEVHRLEQEVKEWKARYAKTKTQLRHMRASSTGLAIPQPNAGRHVKDGGLTQSNGVVKDVHVTKFQISIDELLRVARSGEPALVLDHMKAVVVAVRHITQDMDGASPRDEEETQKRNKLKAKISATANNLITAAKNYVHANGLSPISLLDAAASHLASAVVQLVRTVKIRPTPAGDLEDDDDGSLPMSSSPTYFSLSKDRASGGDSEYSALSSPPTMRPRSLTKESDSSRRPRSRNEPQGPNGMGNGMGTGVQMGFGLRVQDNDIEDLRVRDDTPPKTGRR